MQVNRQLLGWDSGAQIMKGWKVVVLQNSATEKRKWTSLIICGLFNIKYIDVNNLGSK